MPLRFFDQIRFYPASEAELAQIRRDFPVGRHRLRTEAGTFSLRDHEAFLGSETALIDAFRTTQRQAFAEERARWQAADQADCVAEPGGAPMQRADDEWPDAAMRIATQVPGSVWKMHVTPSTAVQASQ